MNPGTAIRIALVGCCLTFLAALLLCVLSLQMEMQILRVELSYVHTLHLRREFWTEQDIAHLERELAYSHCRTDSLMVISRIGGWWHNGALDGLRRCTSMRMKGTSK